MWEDSDEWGDHWVPPPRSDPDYLISRWLKEQPHQQLDPEAKWETEAAERDQILRDFHWAREESPGGIISSLLKHLFLPLKARTFCFISQLATSRP